MIFPWLKTALYLAALLLGWYVMFIALISGQSNRLVNDDVAVGLAFGCIAVSSFMLGRIMLRQGKRWERRWRRERRKRGQLKGPLF